MVYFQVADASSGRSGRQVCQFRQIGREDFTPANLRAGMRSSGSSRASPPCGAHYAGIEQKAKMLFRDAPATIRDEGVDSLIVDQIEMAGGTVADHLGLPLVQRGSRPAG